MLEQFNARLADLDMRRRQQVNAERQLLELEGQLVEAQKVLEQTQNRLAKEQKDVDRLTGISLGNLLYTIIGKKDEKLTREEEELLQVKLAYEEARDTVEDLEEEIKTLRTAMTQLRFIDYEINEVLHAKRQHIMETHPQLGEELQLLSDQASRIQADVKELREATHAGHGVIGALIRAEERLQAARNWGAYDMMGGGMVSTYIKHTHIDEARSSLHDAERSMRRFKRELEDVQRDVNITIEIGNGLTLADYLFDGIFVDWMVQSRIRNAAQDVEQKRYQVQQLVGEVQQELEKRERQLVELEQRQTALVAHA